MAHRRAIDVWRSQQQFSPGSLFAQACSHLTGGEIDNSRSLLLRYSKFLSRRYGKTLDSAGWKDSLLQAIPADNKH